MNISKLSVTGSTSNEFGKSKIKTRQNCFADKVKMISKALYQTVLWMRNDNSCVLLLFLNKISKQAEKGQTVEEKGQLLGQKAAP